jgi:hypothetical protein
MTDPTLTERGPSPPSPGRPGEAQSPPRTGGATTRAAPSGGGRLGHPVAFLATAAVLFALFGWTFVAHTDRAAPTRDPAFYTWRTELIISNEPARLLQLEGAFEMYAAGYRMSAPIIGGLLRQVPGISPINTTALLMAALPVLIALLLAGFAYRQLRDPLAFHAVALVSASLLLTPPFVGYIDNVLTLFFLAAGIWFIGPSRTSWGARAGLFSMMLLSGLAHPTTLAIFFPTLCLIAGVRWLTRRFDFKSVLRDDGPMLATGLAALVATLSIWTIGVWGPSASLGESALAPPYGRDFFLDRMMNWIEAMNPWLNAPLFFLGMAGLIASYRRRWAENDLSVVSLVWLAPLIGSFGFMLGLAYPYYRFFNTTLAWLLLVGLGAYFAARFFVVRTARGGASRLLAVGLVALAAIVWANFSKGYQVSGWNDPDRAWISDTARRDLAALRDHPVIAAAEGPIVFVIDDEPPRPFQIWGFTKLSGNTSRHGLPHEAIDRAHMYLGSLDNFLDGEPTLRGQETYDMLSPALLEEVEREVTRTGAPPVAVVAGIFNPAGENVAYATGERPLPRDGRVEVIGLHEGRIFGPEEPADVAATAEPATIGPFHLLRVLAGLALLLLPGMLALRWFVSDAGLPEALGMVPALGVAVTTLTTFVVIAVVRSPLSPALASISVLLAVALGAILLWASGRRLHPSPS